MARYSPRVAPRYFGGRDPGEGIEDAASLFYQLRRQDTLDEERRERQEQQDQEREEDRKWRERMQRLSLAERGWEEGPAAPEMPTHTVNPAGDEDTATIFSALREGGFQRPEPAPPAPPANAFVPGRGFNLRYGGPAPQIANAQQQQAPAQAPGAQPGGFTPSPYPQASLGDRTPSRYQEAAGFHRVRPEVQQEEELAALEQTLIAEGIPPSQARILARSPNLMGDLYPTVSRSGLDESGVPTQVRGRPDQVDDVDLRPDSADDDVNWQTVQTDQGLVQINPRTGESRPLGLRPPASASGGGAGGGGVSGASKLRSEYEGNPVVKQSMDIAQSYQRVIQSAREPSAAGDLALVFNYMKMLDPGSVVREGEFATAQNASGVPGRIRAAYNNVLRGERMADEQRQDFTQRAQMIAEGQRELLRVVSDRYTGFAEEEGLDPSHVVHDPFASFFEEGADPDTPVNPFQ